jgi:TubC N-terminal docking domain
MNAEEVLLELRSRGAYIEVCDQRLRIEAPRGVITSELRQALVAHKSKLIASLADQCSTIVPCPGDGCSEMVRLKDGKGWCPNHRMSIIVATDLNN